MGSWSLLTERCMEGESYQWLGTWPLTRHTICFSPCKFQMNVPCHETEQGLHLSFHPTQWWLSDSSCTLNRSLTNLDSKPRINRNSNRFFPFSKVVISNNPSVFYLLIICRGRVEGPWKWRSSRDPGHVDTSSIQGSFPHLWCTVQYPLIATQRKARSSPHREVWESQAAEKLQGPGTWLLV